MKLISNKLNQAAFMCISLPNDDDNLTLFVRDIKIMFPKKFASKLHVNNIVYIIETPLAPIVEKLEYKKEYNI